MIKHSLQRTDQILLAQTRRHLQQRRLVKLLDRAAALQQPAHDWARHHCPRGHIGHCSRCRLHSRGYRSQPRNGLMLKHRPRRDHQTRLARAAHQLDRDDAVAAKLKEIVVNPNPPQPQHFRKQPTQDLLLRRARPAPLHRAPQHWCR